MFNPSAAYSSNQTADSALATPPERRQAIHRSRSASANLPHPPAKASPRAGLAQSAVAKPRVPRDPQAAPMRWAGANHSGAPVFGVAASATELGSVDITAFVVAGSASTPPSLRRTLSTFEARRLAEHLAAAAEEAERCEALQLVATA